jgi:hypothetical protein
MNVCVCVCYTGPVVLHMLLEGVAKYLLKCILSFLEGICRKLCWGCENTAYQQ